MIDEKERQLVTNDQRFFEKVYSNMALGSLWAVDQAYDERDIEERQKDLKRQTQSKYDSKEEAQLNLAVNKSEKLEEIKNKESQDKANLESGRLKVGRILFSVGLNLDSKWSQF